MTNITSWKNKMNRVFFWAYFTLGLIILNTHQTFGKNVLLEVGETYQEENLAVVCVESKGAEPVIMKDCQFWDDFNNKCLYEKKIFVYHDIECLEECQHWDSFNNKCNYATQCSFYPSQKLFIHTICAEFDSFSHTCKRTKENKITQ